MKSTVTSLSVGAFRETVNSAVCPSVTVTLLTEKVGVSSLSIMVKVTGLPPIVAVPGAVGLLRVTIICSFGSSTSSPKTSKLTVASLAPGAKVIVLPATEIPSPLRATLLKSVPNVALPEAVKSTEPVTELSPNRVIINSTGVISGLPSSSISPSKALRD